jgi:hypothetical protein
VAPAAYFAGFKPGNAVMGSHRALGSRHVSVLDDHDHVFGEKIRFSSEAASDRQVTAAAALQLFALGIPCLYYGTEHALGGPAPLWVVFLVGGAAGWISAFGGAWKDAPIEGFQILKFFRSPFMAGVYAVLVSLLTDDLVFITMAAEGFVIMTTETYKTFFFPSKPRGKFANKPVVFPEWLRLRQRFVPLYVLIWLVVIGAYGVAVSRGDKVPVNLWERASD